MKVRILWVPPGPGPFIIGEVYDLADGQNFVDGSTAEAVDSKTKALPDPRPASEPAADAA
jgi:hypothetical protein